MAKIATLRRPEIKANERDFRALPTKRWTRLECIQFVRDQLADVYEDIAEDKEVQKMCKSGPLRIKANHDELGHAVEAGVLQDIIRLLGEEP